MNAMQKIHDQIMLGAYFNTNLKEEDSTRYFICRLTFGYNVLHCMGLLLLYTVLFCGVMEFVSPFCSLVW